MKTSFIIMFAVLLITIPLASASLGTYQQYSCVDIKTILNTTAVNISSISFPNSTLIISNQPMTETGFTFNYTFCNTSAPGNYIYDYVDAEGNVYVNDFIITPTIGAESNTTFFLFFLILAFVLLLIAFIFKNTIFSFFSGITFLVAGVYSIIYGFGNITNQYTHMLALIIIGFGAIITIVSALEFIKETSGGDNYYPEEEED